MSVSCRECPRFHSRVMKSVDGRVVVCECELHFGMKMIGDMCRKKDIDDAISEVASSFEKNMDEQVVKNGWKECVFYSERLLEEYNA